MKLLKDDIFFSRLLQLSLLGTLLLLLVLMLTESTLLETGSFSLSSDDAKLLEQHTSDSLVKSTPELWLQHSLDWFHENIISPFSQ